MSQQQQQQLQQQLHQLQQLQQHIDIDAGSRQGRRWLWQSRWLPQQKPQVRSAVLRPHNWKRRKRHADRDDRRASSLQVSTEMTCAAGEDDHHRQQRESATTTLTATTATTSLDLSSCGDQKAAEANAFYLYQLSLRLGPFKRSVCLFGGLALALVATLAALACARFYRLGKFSPPEWAPLLASLLQLGAVLLVAHQIFFRFQLDKAKPQRDHFGQLQLALLISSAVFAALLASLRVQLIAVQPVVMFILYTLLSVNNKRAFVATLAANLIQLVSMPFVLSSPSSSSSSPLTANTRLLVSVIFS